MNRIKYLIQHLFIYSFIAFASTPAQAQIIPDNTLGKESSQLTPNVLIKNGLGDRIDGGAIRGSNLFHSFSEFNINNDQRVYFNNPTGIQNILTRVTGANASYILGTLGVRQLASLDDDKEIRGQGRQGGRGDLENSQVATTTIVEAQGFVKAADGTITLVAQVPNATPSSRPIPVCVTR